VTEAIDAAVRFDEAAGPLERPYAVTGGRTQASREFFLITLVAATGVPLQAGATPEHGRILGACQNPKGTSVAEISAHLRRPVAVIKILLGDLLGWRVIVAQAPVNVKFSESARRDPRLLKAVMDGLRNL